MVPASRINQCLGMCLLKSSSCPQAMAHGDTGDGKGLQMLMELRCSGLISSQICEDFFNHQKNHKILRGSRRFRKAERAFGVGVSSKVVSQVHHYEAVPVDMALPARAVRLPPEAFAAAPALAKMNFKQVSGTKPKPEWFSPGAPNWCHPDADLHLMSHAHRCNDWTMLSTAWVGALCDSEHKLLVRPSGAIDCFMVLHHWPDSPVLALPVNLVKVPRHPEHMWVEFRMDWTEPCLLAVASLDGVLAHTYTWRSPLWLYANFPRAPAEFCRAVRPMLDSCVADPLLTIAAKHSFWSVDKTTLDGLAGDLKV